MIEYGPLMDHIMYGYHVWIPCMDTVYGYCESLSWSFTVPVRGIYVEMPTTGTNHSLKQG